MPIFAREKPSCSIATSARIPMEIARIMSRPEPGSFCCSARRSRRLIGKTQEKGLTLVPIRVYLKRGRIKIELGVARGKKLYDKRETERRKETDREAQGGHEAWAPLGMNLRLTIGIQHQLEQIRPLKAHAKTLTLEVIHAHRVSDSKIPRSRLRYAGISDLRRRKGRFCVPHFAR